MFIEVVLEIYWYNPFCGHGPRWSLQYQFSKSRSYVEIHFWYCSISDLLLWGRSSKL